MALDRGREPIRAKILMSTGRTHHYGHLLQVWKESLQPLTLYTSFHDLINLYSCRSGQTTPGDKILISTETSSHFSHLLQVSKNLFEAWFYTIFLMILYMFIALGKGLTTPWGRNFDVNRKACHFCHLLQVSKKSLWSLILYNFFFFMILYMYIAAGAEQRFSPQGTKFWCQQKCLVTSFICCKFQKHVFEVLILYIFFHDLIQCI